jgi:spore coat polysaccharide biosynthesis predicted glycosyltransferase SpsG
MRASSVLSVRALFRVAAGPRLGFGHLVRARSLAQALGIARPCVSLRGTARARRSAAALGVRLAPGSPADVLGAVRPDVLVIDDPSRTASLPWCRAARREGVAVVSVHDLGIAFCGADLTVDGSIVPPAVTPAGLLSGPSYAVLAPAVRAARGTRRHRDTVLIALGGGPRLGVALRLARALRASRPGLLVRIVGGLNGNAKRSRPEDGIVLLGAVDGLAGELARCAVAITGGGVTLYEAAALDTPVVAWPVVAAQHPTVIGFERRGLAAAVLPGPRRTQRLVSAVAAALGARRGRRTSDTVDGRGAFRVADRIRALLQRDLAEAV